MSQISVIIHDIRSSHNVGSILRTCDGFGISKVYIGGISPYPLIPGDTRLPHIAQKLTKDITKTALGAEQSVNIELYDSLELLVESLKKSGTAVLGLEQTPQSISLQLFKKPTGNLALLLGREVEGIEEHYISLCDSILEIPMHGLKESFNVSVATGIALYALCLAP